ncbi:hypothetical protein [Gordonia alkaliphila]|uniref:DUF4232 domain-containing protein n=1 Tax=Gordonia alkaliphila TaxID=1053547 RepID=A0ABP8Z2S2_9ACTN
MEKSVSITSLVRRAGVIAVAGAATAALAGVGAGSAQAAPGDNLTDRTCLQYSQDGGATWGGHDEIDWLNINPIPGQQALRASFDIRNKCETPAHLQIFAGDWKVSGGGSAVVRANAGAQKGALKDLEGTPGIFLVKTPRLAQNKKTPVELFIGLPADETKQGFTIQPDWRIFLAESEPDAPVDPGPGDGGDGGSGSSGSSTGSLGDLFGSLSSADVKPAGKTVGKSLNSPSVTAGR